MWTARVRHGALVERDWDGVLNSDFAFVSHVLLSE